MVSFDATRIPGNTCKPLPLSSLSTSSIHEAWWQQPHHARIHSLHRRFVGPAPSRGGQRCWDPEHDHEGGQQGQLPCSSFLVSGSCDSISSLGVNWHKWRRVSGVWSVTRECGHEKVHALVVSLRTKRRKKKKTEREERRRRKVGLTHACPKTESAGRVKTAASSPIVGNGCACRLSGTLAALHFSTKPRERESVCVCVFV